MPSVLVCSITYVYLVINHAVSEIKADILKVPWCLGQLTKKRGVPNADSVFSHRLYAARLLFINKLYVDVHCSCYTVYVFVFCYCRDVFLEKHWKSVIHRSICDYFFEAQSKVDTHLCIK